MARRFLSILSLTLIFALGIEPVLVLAQTEEPLPETTLGSEQIQVPETVDPAPTEEPLQVEAPIDPTTYVAGEVIVKYKDSKTVDAVVDSLDMTAVDTIAGQNIVVVSTDGASVESAIAALETSQEIEYAEPNYVRNIETLSSTSPELTNLWAFQNTGQTVNSIPGTNDADTDAVEAWSYATGTDVVVAVIDTGVDYTHTELADQMWDGTACVDENGDALGNCIHGYDFEYDDLDPKATSTDSTGSHGTHVSGIIAASNNDANIVGIAPGAKIMALRFALDTASEVRAIDFAIQNGAKIINASYGGSSFSQSEFDAIERFQNAGGLFIAAAGNDSHNLDTNPTNAYPAEYDLPSIISVAATDQDDLRAWYSNYGSTTVDLAAPGDNIRSLIPVEGYGYKSGTSMAAPMVAGAVALVTSLRPDLSASDIKSTLLGTGDALASLASKTVSGKRLNVASALASVYVAPVVDTEPPVITLIGANPLPLTVGDTFTDPGAEVTDNVDATTTITGVGTVDTATAGTYTLTYNATDQALNAATSTTRSVVVSAAAVASSGGGSSRRRGGGGSSSTTNTASSAANYPRTLFGGGTTYTFSQNLQTGSTGSEVSQLQSTLARLGLYSGPVSGYFGPLTQSALKAFQQSKGLEPVGRVGAQTRALLNGSSAAAPASVSTNALISALQAQLQVLIAQLALLQAKST